MAVNLSPVGGVAGQFFDNNGDPLVGGKLFTYAAGTTTPQVTYTSATGVTANSNPIILNGGGRVPAEIWLTDGLQYKFVLYSSTDQLIGSWDNIIGINSNFVNFTTAEEVQVATAGQTVFTLTTMQYAPSTNNLVVYVDGVNQIEGGAYSFVETSSTVVTFVAGLHVGALVKFVSAEALSTGVVDSSNVIYTPAGSGAVATNVQAKLRETVSVKDFGAVGDGVTDDTAAINAAMTYAVANNKVVIFDFDATIRVPTDAPTLQDAVDHAATAYLTNSITLLIQTGHQPESGIEVYNGDFSMFTVESEDATVTLSASFPNTAAFIFGESAVLPFLGTLVNMNGRGLAGYYARRNSSGYVLANCGIYGLGTGGSFGNQAPGLFANGGCVLYAVQSKSYNNPRNVWITRDSNFNGETSDFSGATGDIAIYGSRNCTLHIPDCDITNSAGGALVLRRSRATADATDFSSAGATAITLERTSQCSMSSRGGVKPKVNNSANDGISISEGSCFHFLDGEITNNARDGIAYAQGSIGSVVSATITGNGRYGLAVRSGSTINASSCTITGNTPDLFIPQGGYVSLSSVVTGAGTLTKSIANITEVRPGPSGVIWTSGAGTPEGVVAASRGSIFTRTDGGAGTTLYIKESGTGNTGWAAK
jgi:hypothetical protein